MKQRIPVGHIALESFFIVLAVAVALVANSWREHRVAKQRAEVALEAIEDEVRANAQALRAAASYHSTLLGRLSAHQGNEPPSMSMFSRGFVSAANLSRHAWRSAANTGALDVAPYERVLELESAYQDQARYEQQSAVVSGEIYRLLFDGGTDRVRESWQNLRAVLASMAYRECALIRTLESRLGNVASAEGDRAEAGPAESLPAACAQLSRSPGFRD